jgi:hypothetical protein
MYTGGVLMDKINVNQPLLDAVGDCVKACTKSGLPRRGYLNGREPLSMYCAVWAALFNDGVYTLKSGPCHSNIDYLSVDDNHTKENTIALISWPYTSREKATTKEVKEEAGFSEEFLDAYYKWLTTTPILEGVFLEPWNGEYLVVNPAAPANAVLMALIASRIPTETIYWGVEREWRKLIEGGVSWPLSLVVIDGFRDGYRIDGLKTYKTVPGHASHHTVFQRSTMDQSSLVAIANEIPIKDVNNARISPPFNKGGDTRQVFAIYNRTPLLPDHLVEVSKEILNFRRVGKGFNVNDVIDTSVTNYLDKFIPHVLEWQSTLIEEK